MIQNLIPTHLLQLKNIALDKIAKYSKTVTILNYPMKTGEKSVLNYEKMERGNIWLVIVAW